MINLNFDPKALTDGELQIEQTKQKERNNMHANNPDPFRPLISFTEVGGFAISLRSGALQCVRCGQLFGRHDAQEFEDGIRFTCSGCGLDALEVVPA